jgi:hypothetical protein
MRKIEMQILEALRNKANFSADNTEVIVSDAGNIQVLLHGSPVVRIEDSGRAVFISLAGWNTPTTRGRISLVLSHYGLSQVSNKGGVAYCGAVALPNTGWLQVMRKSKEIPAKLEK